MHTSMLNPRNPSTLLPPQGPTANLWTLLHSSSASVSSLGLHGLGRIAQRLSLRKGFQVVDTCQSHGLQPLGMLCGVTCHNGQAGQPPHARPSGAAEVSQFWTHVSSMQVAVLWQACRL